MMNVVAKTKEQTIQQSARLTFEEALKVAAGRNFELIDGKIFYKGADVQHAEAHAQLGYHLGVFLEENPVGHVFMSLTHLLLPDNPYEARTPDISVIRSEKLQSIEDYPTFAPDIAIEIVSLEDKWTFLFDKANLFLQTGSRQVWLVDPYQKAALIMKSDSRYWVEDSVTSPELLPGFSVKLKDIFTWPSKPEKANENK